MTSASLEIPLREKGIRLTLSRNNGGRITAILCLQKSPAIFLFALCDIAEAYVDVDTSAPSLWLGTAAFEIRKEDIEKIMAAFDIKQRSA